MFPVGSFVKITDISECKKVELNEVFKVLSSSKVITTIENKDGINLGGYYSWRFVAADPVADATKTIIDDDWFVYDGTKFPNHILRAKTDWLRQKGSATWEIVTSSAGKIIGPHTTFEFRCKKSDAPTAEVAKPQVASATEDDWVVIDKSIYGDFKLRLIDECNYKNTKWMKVVNDCGNSYNHIYYKDYEFRCKRSDLPVANATKSQTADATKSPAITNLCKEVEQQPISKKDAKMFPVGSFVEITDISNCGKVKLNEVFEVVDSNKSLTTIKNKDGINLGIFDTWRFAPVADVTNPPAVQNKNAKMFKNRFEVGQKILCTDGASAKRITNGKEYVVINNDYDNNGSGMDMLEVINDNGCRERYFVYRFSAAIAEDTAVAEKVAAAKRRVVAKVTNTYLTKGQSYEVVDDGDGTTVIVGPNSYSLCFIDDCFESDISLSDVTSVDGATGTKENEMKKETAIKAASVVGKFAAGWGFRALNYWAIEPAVNIARPILSSVRYAGFLAAISMIGYGMYNPQAVKDAAYSCIPKISFSIEAPEILNGK